MNLWKKYGPQLLILLAVWLAYSGTLSHQYAGDDAIVITQNERVQAGLSGIPALFKNIKSEQTQHRYGYRPITLLTFATEVELFGLNPFWPHFFNVVLYSLLCLLLYGFLQRIFADTKPLWLLAVVLLFSLHPLHAEVVANIKSRDEILAMLFGILFLWQVIRWNERPTWQPIVLAMFLALLGFWSKENAFGYVLAGLALPLLRSAKLDLQVLKGMAPVLASLILLVIAYGLSQSLALDNSFELAQKGVLHEDRFAANPLVDYGQLVRIQNAFVIIGMSLRLFLVPHPLVHDYGIHVIHMATSWADWSWLLPLVLAGALAFIGFRFRKTRPEVLFGLWFFLSTMAIYLHVPIAGPDFFGERFLFGPLLGLALFAVSLLAMLPRNLSILVMVNALIALGTVTHLRAGDWKTTETLYAADKENLADCARFQFNYANHLHRKYYDAPAAEQGRLKQQFFYHYERALELTDRILLAYLDLGSAYMEFNFPQKALPVFEKCVQKYGHLSAPFFELGRYYISQEDFDRAHACFYKAIERGETNPSAYYMKAVCEVKLDRITEAQNTLEKGRDFGAQMDEYRALMNKLGMR